jgi:predicted RNA binding protein with dsRBD fold (UPF0201 family)
VGHLRALLRIELRALVRPTEDAGRVEAAIRNLFPDAALALRPRNGREEREWTGTSPDAVGLRNRVRDQRIPDTARSVLLRGKMGASARFHLGKQAAFMGKASFGAQPGALGEIEVTLTASDERELLYAIYDLAFDTTVPEDLARIPREYRPSEGVPPADSFQAAPERVQDRGEPEDDAEGHSPSEF